jgi:hypothetical protein
VFAISQAQLAFTCEPLLATAERLLEREDHPLLRQQLQDARQALRERGQPEPAPKRSRHLDCTRPQARVPSSTLELQTSTLPNEITTVMRCAHLRARMLSAGGMREQPERAACIRASLDSPWKYEENMPM